VNSFSKVDCDDEVNEKDKKQKMKYIVEFFIDIFLKELPTIVPNQSLNL
jgi:hypothetical protein